jgi:hypothetical protein
VAFVSRLLSGSDREQAGLRVSLPASVFPGRLLDRLTRRVPDAEPGDFDAVIPAQHDQAEVVYKIQVIAVAEKRSFVAIHAL